MPSFPNRLLKDLCLFSTARSMTTVPNPLVTLVIGSQKKDRSQPFIRSFSSISTLPFHIIGIKTNVHDRV